MTRIIAIFFSAAVFFSAIDLAGEGITISGGSPEMLERVMALDSHLGILFRGRSVRYRKRAMEIAFGSREIRLVSRPGGIRVSFPDQKDFFKEKELYQALVSALLFRHFGGVQSRFSPAAVPLWMCAAVAERMDSYSKAERFIHGLKIMPTVSAMMEIDRLPDLSSVMTLPPDLEDPWFRQYSRALLEFALAQGLLSEFSASVWKTPDHDAFLKTFEKKLISALGGRRDISSLLWRSYLPEPAFRKLGDLDRIRKFSIPELNEKKEPSGKLIECPISKFPGETASRPDVSELRKMAVSKLREFSFGSDFSEQRQLRKMAGLLFDNGDPAAASASLEVAMKDLEKLLKRRLAREKWLLNMDYAYGNIRNLLSYRFDPPASLPLLSPEQQTFLLEIEKIYTD